MNAQTTVPRSKVSELFGQVGAPLFLLFIYGVYELITSGFGTEHKWHTYIPIALGAVGICGLELYWHSVSKKKRSFRAMFASFAGLVPLLALAYMTFYLGAYSVFGLFFEFSVPTLLRSLAFTLIGFRGATGLAELSEIGIGVVSGKVIFEDR